MTEHDMRGVGDPGGTQDLHDLDDLDDATVVVAQGDETIVVARDGVTNAEPHGDATIVVARDEAAPAGATDDPSAVSQQRTGGRVGAVHAWPAPSASRGGAGGDPVEESEEIPPELAKLLFKNPLDAKRRAPVSPFPAEQSSLPRGGVRGGMPVVYGARGEGFGDRAGRSDLGRALGTPPAGYELPAADRDALPSLARLNRRVSALAWTGALVVPVVAGVGLWWVLTLLLSP